MTFKRFIRRTAEFFLNDFFGHWGKKIIRQFAYYREPPIFAVPWSDIRSIESHDIVDSNIKFEDKYCPICNSDSSFDLIADQVFSFQKVYTRKRLYQCVDCNFLFTNEKRIPREKYFKDTPYLCDSNGIRSQREIDLVKLALKAINGSKMSSLLIYAIGNNQTVDILTDLGFSNAYGSDIASEVKYGRRIINIEDDPRYFIKQGVKFDIIIACEVWEHYERHDMNDSFKWIFSHLSPNGIVIGTTALWMATEHDDKYYNLPLEVGQRQLKWWFYAHTKDHTSFYRADNLRRIGERFNMYTEFSYFADKRVWKNEPSKRIIAFTRCENKRTIEYLRKNFKNKYHKVFYY